METHMPVRDDLIFVLDIGTRSVVGIAGYKQGGLFVVEHSESRLHSRRAMIDGQIEDIEQVAQVAQEVKLAIEQKLNVSFKRVSVAAAGRSLKTCRATVKTEFSSPTVITAPFVYQIENDALMAARGELQQDDISYFCAGYSVVRYLLDDYPFSTAIGHKASHVQVEVIATFLPAEVVESLRRCMQMLGLEIDTMTLEPIAAMRAVVPQDIRLLNLALVDVGAGTSDIALSANGTVAGYTMATVAGDEITEALIRSHLVDFQTAERLKSAVSSQESIEFEDILGFSQTASAQELKQSMLPAVQTLAQVVAERIIEANGGCPTAVFLVGGGSMTPDFPKLLAEEMGLAHNKVALAGTRFSGRVLNEGSGLDGPLYATPVGIALIAADNADVQGASVNVNGQRVRLFTTSETRVMDALLLAGYRYSDLMGRYGRPLTFVLNGVPTIKRGGMYTSAELLINGQSASLSATVKKDDVIELTPAVCGEDATAQVCEYAENTPFITVHLNGEQLMAGLVIRINGQPVSPDAPIFEHDLVEVFTLITAGELCKAAGFSPDGKTLLINDKPSDSKHILKQGDVIDCPDSDKAEPTAAHQPNVPLMKRVAPPKPPSQKDASPEQSASSTHDVPSAEGAPSASQDGLSLVTKTTVFVSHDVGAPISAELNTDKNASSSTQNTDDVSSFSPLGANRTEPFDAPISDDVDVSLEVPKVSDGMDAPQASAQILADDTDASCDISKSMNSSVDDTSEEAAASTPIEPAEISSQNAEDDTPKANADNTDAGTEKVSDSLEEADNSEELDASNEEQATLSTSFSGRSLRIELNGKTVVLPPKGDGTSHLLMDMLTLVDMDLRSPKGMPLIQINGKEAPFQEPLINGDVVTIGWREGFSV